MVCLVFKLSLKINLRGHAIKNHRIKRPLISPLPSLPTHTLYYPTIYTVDSGVVEGVGRVSLLRSPTYTDSPL